ncbi:TrkH family potassium uptake protein [Pontibacillus salicampi]|uniref:TrkH family potassium uptake protein n=1 Tax=Pontibacillus salicampi TaxID=1449801 RepID=A0ABV6LQH2_9BACI
MKHSSRFKTISNLTPVQIIVLFYIAAVVISTILLSLPMVHKPNVEWSFIDAVFTAVSAISVTGLTVVSTSDTFNELGYVVLLFVLQFGGIGIMTLGTFIYLVIGKRIGLRERKLIMTDQNQSNLAGLVKLMKEILILVVSIEAIGAVILSIYYISYFPTWPEAIMQGVFASVSATTNAGFDITGDSLVPFADDYFVQLIQIALLIFGAIGFPVLIELKEFIRYKKKSSLSFSLFTKITTITFLLLIMAGMLVILVFEWDNFLADKRWDQSLFYALFQSVTTRNGGLATMDVSEFSTPTLVSICFLMFVGASPSSVGGGIRTTTFAIAVLSVFFYAKGKSSIKLFRREVDPNDTIRSFIVIFTATLLVGSGVVLLTLFEPQFTLLELLFEACSAFGTTGLSLGITSELSVAGKIVIIALMFIGRIGIFSFLFLIRGSTRDDAYHLPKENVIIG